MSMYDTTLSQKYIKDMGICKKKIKDAYPKKVCHMFRHVKKKERIKDAYPKKACHMPTRHVKKKKEKENIAHTNIYIYIYTHTHKGERIHIKEFHPPSTRNIHTLALLDQGL